MFRKWPIVVRTILDTVFGLPGVLIFGVLGGIAFGSALGRLQVLDMSMPEKSASGIAPMALPGDNNVSWPVRSHLARSPPRTCPVVLSGALAGDNDLRTMLAGGYNIVPRTIADDTPIAKAGDARGHRSPSIARYCEGLDFRWNSMR